MAKRRIVQIDIDKTKVLIKKECRSNTAFCEKMKKHIRWVSDWSKPIPQNLPSPEEAAKMCAILNVQPEDIITDADDVVIVRELMKKEKPVPDGDELKRSKLDQLNAENRALVEAMIDKLLSAQSSQE